MTHYDSYGKRIFVIPGRGPHTDTTIRNGEHRYLLWVTNDWTGNGHTGQHKTYRTKWMAVRRAKKLAKQGLGVMVSDRFIRPGDAGYLADHSGSYLMTLDGVLHTGTFEENWRRPNNRTPVYHQICRTE